jgi:hypothetical protein
LVEIKGLCTDAEYESFKSIVGKVMGSMLLDGINVLSKRFPELKPPGLD